jgi:hypothetical protein
MPGTHPDSAAYLIFRYINSPGKLREIVIRHSATVVNILNSALDVTSCPVILDPWAGAQAVVKGLHIGNAKLCINEQLGCTGVHLMYNPLESVLYEKVKATFGRLDAVVTCPPEIMADMALINSLQFAGQLVCMFVREDYLRAAHAARRALLVNLESAGRLLVIKDLDPACEHVWLCIFASMEDRIALLRPGMEPGSSNYLLMERRND